MNDSVITLDSLSEQALEAPLATSLPQYEPGEYEAQIVKVMDPDKVVPQSGRSAGETKYVMKVRFKPLGVDDSDGVERATPHLSVWLDVTPSGKLASGKSDNIALGRLYEACGINKPGVRPTDLTGQVCMIQVGHDIMRDGSSLAVVKKAYAKAA